MGTDPDSSQAPTATRYWAFLSYSHADEVVAARLHKALEHYVLPAKVRRAHALPRRLVPIFRDAEELAAASSLTGRLQDALTDSRWLVVLCSPAAARSRYVNEEIEYFLKAHGAGRILCALVEGEPAQAFPPAIRALPQEPLAADLRPGTDFSLGTLQLLAALAGVGFSELRDREAARRRRQRLLAVAALGGVAIGTLAYWDLFVREHVDFYGSYVREHGIWQGVDHLDAGTVQHRNVSYRFVRRGQLHAPERVDYYKGCGTFEKPGMEDILRRPIDLGNVGPRNCAATFRYHSDGTIAAETLVNARGTSNQTLTYTEPGLAQLTEGGFAAETTGSGIAYVQFTRDERGRDVTLLYLRSRDQPRRNPAHAFGYVLGYDEAGHLVRESALDDRGAEFGEVTQRRYDAAGYLTQLAYLDTTGDARNSEEGYARVDFENDAWGNPLRRAFFDAAGAPTMDSEGVYGTAWEWDDRGNRVQVTHLDAAGKPAADGSGISRKRSEFDARGFRTRLSFAGVDGSPVTDDDGAARYELDNDPWGDLLANRLLDAKGEPARHGNGMSEDRKKFDDHGRVLEEAFFGADGKPVMLVYGAMFRNTYDARGNTATREYFDTDGKRYARPGSGCAMLRFKRDARGNLVEVSCLDAELKPVRGYVGWAYRGFAYDEDGNTTEGHMYGVDHEPVLDRRGYSVRRAKFDRSGNEVEVRYYDAADRPTLNTEDQTWGQTLGYDNRGRVVRATNLNASGAPAMAPVGWARSDFTRDASGAVTRAQYFDAAGAPIGGGKPAELRYEYDSHHRERARRYIAASGKAAAGPYGYASLLTDYDDSGHLVAERCLDPSDKPVARHPDGWATHRIDYAGGRRIEHWFDAAGHEIPAPK